MVPTPEVVSGTGTVPLKIDYWYLGLQVVAYGIVLYRAHNAMLKAYDFACRSLFPGASVRLWFLSILTLALSSRIVSEILLAADLLEKPFWISWSYYLPSLICLSSYSLIIVFFADTRYAVNDGDDEAHRIIVHPRNMAYIAPVIIAVNTLIYLLFAVAASLAHLKHAHREFRIAGSLFIGGLYSIMCLVWGYQATLLAVKLHQRSQIGDQLLLLDQPFVRRPHFSPAKTYGGARYACTDDEGNDDGVTTADTMYFGTATRTTVLNSSSSVWVTPKAACGSTIRYYVDSLNDMKRSCGAVKRRIWCLAFACPLLFGVRAWLEIHRGLLWLSAADRQAALTLFYTYGCWQNFILALTDILPAVICIMAFTDAEAQLDECSPTYEEPLLL